MDRIRSFLGFFWMERQCCLSSLSEHSIVIAGGYVFSWGRNSHGQLGHGNGNRDSCLPKLIEDLTNVDSVSCGFRHSMALSYDGHVFTWGSNKYGQLGIGKYLERSLFPQKISNLTNIIDISCGFHHSMALSDDGHIFTWGYNQYGQLGHGKKGSGKNFSTSTPRQIKDLTNVYIVSIACGGYHSMALSDGGEVYAWGDSEYGQIGIKTSNTPLFQRQTQRGISKPQHIKTLSNVISIACGGSHSMALSNDDKLYSWGYNRYGQLGNGNTIKVICPQQNKYLVNVKAFSCGSHHSMALSDRGELYSWGYNVCGQLGIGNTKESFLFTPQHIQTLSNIVSIACGSSHSMAISEDGQLYSWGDNKYGKLGNGNQINSSSPQQIILERKNLKWKSTGLRLIWEIQRIIWIGKLQPIFPVETLNKEENSQTDDTILQPTFPVETLNKEENSQTNDTILEFFDQK